SDGPGRRLVALTGARSTVDETGPPLLDPLAQHAVELRYLVACEQEGPSTSGRRVEDVDQDGVAIGRLVRRPHRDRTPPGVLHVLVECVHAAEQVHAVSSLCSYAESPRRRSNRGQWWCVWLALHVSAADVAGVLLCVGVGARTLRLLADSRDFGRTLLDHASSSFSLFRTAAARAAVSGLM